MTELFILFLDCGGLSTFCTRARIGGLVLLSDGNTNIYSAQKTPIPRWDPEPGADNTDRSWFAFWLDDLVKRMNVKNLDKLGGEYMGWYLNNDEELEYIDERPYYPPVNWDGGEMPHGREIGMLMATNLLVCAPVKPQMYSILTCSGS